MTRLGLTVYNPAKAYHGYTLFAPMEGTNVYLIDLRGHIVHRWQMPYRPGDYGYLLKNGHLLVGGRTNQCPVNIGGKSGIVMELDWEGRVIWEYVEDTLHHDFCRMANGHILIFDNGWHSLQAPSPRSRVIEVDPTTNSIQWTYETLPPWDFFSAFISGAQRLPNGNTLICEGMTGRLFEVTSGGEMVWEYVNPFFGDDERFGHANRLFRAYRYGPDFPGFEGRTLNPERYAWLSHLYATQPLSSL